MKCYFQILDYIVVFAPVEEWDKTATLDESDLDGITANFPPELVLYNFESTSFEFEHDPEEVRVALTAAGYIEKELMEE